MSGYAAVDEWLEHVAQSFGSPAYVYFTQPIEQRVKELKAAFGTRFQFSFAAKSNPNPALLRWLAHHIEFLDVSSIGEFRLGVDAGWDPSRSSFTGPGKRNFELREAIEEGIGELVLESVREAIAADEIARSLGRTQRVLIRIAPSHVPKGFGDHMAGRPCAFGIDQEQMNLEIPQILELANLHVVGLHIYSGTQCLKAQAVCDNYRNFLSIFREICNKFDLRPEKLVFGSGLGIPYHDGDAALDLRATAQGIVEDLDALKLEHRFADTNLILELGRYLVGEAGYFLTRVISVKESRGRRIGICDGGLNNHLAASGHFGMVIHRNYTMHKIGGDDFRETIDLVGPLCTSIDRLASGVMLARVEEGDLIAIHNSGAYGLTASPIHFISHAPPHEILVDGSQMHDVSRMFGQQTRV